METLTKIFFLAAIQEAKLPTGERVVTERPHPTAISDYTTAQQCLKSLYEQLRAKGQVGPIMHDGFTLIYPNGHVITWIIKEKAVINRAEEFKL